jgi:TM2 domain-containing membrane protein YozV
LPHPTVSPSTTSNTDTSNTKNEQPNAYQPEEHEGGIIVGKHPIGLKQNVEPEKGKSFMVTFLLSLFLGLLGADRFYLGEVGMGIFKLLTAGGLGVWYVVDLFNILTNNKKDKNGAKLRGYKKHLPMALSILGAWILFLVFLVVFDALVFRHRASSAYTGFYGRSNRYFYF